MLVMHFLSIHVIYLEVNFWRVWYVLGKLVTDIKNLTFFSILGSKSSVWCPGGESSVPTNRDQWVFLSEEKMLFCLQKTITFWKGRILRIPSKGTMFGKRVSTI